jgi:hypothetical protein
MPKKDDYLPPRPGEGADIQSDNKITVYINGSRVTMDKIDALMLIQQIVNILAHYETNGV